MLYSGGRQRVNVTCSQICQRRSVWAFVYDRQSETFSAASTARCYAERGVLPRQVVRLSVCPSVCLWRWDIAVTQVGILRK